MGHYRHLIGSDFVKKERAIWHPRSVQLLREKATARYALEVVPRVIDGTNVGFPETEISLGPRVLVKSKRIKGRPLLEMLYTQETQDFALDIAMVALKALNRAVVTFDPFVLFGIAYGLARKLKITLSERLGVSVLPPEQRVKLDCLVSSYIKPRKGERKVLVHGDLHANNLIVNREERWLKFVDLEMVHIGKSATNFAQLWISFHLADPSLGRRLYQRYVSQLSETLTEHFDSDVKAEVALRCHSLVRHAKKDGNAELAQKARLLLGNVLSDESFETFVLSQKPSSDIS